jgi:hypothetical protein
MIAAHDLFENDYARFWIADNILFFEYKPNTVIDLKVATSVVTDRIHFQNGRSFPVLCDIRGIISTEKAGRDYLAQFGSILTLAVGLIMDEKVSLTISSFYVKINKPTVPTKIFTKQEEALGYLKEFI